MDITKIKKEKILLAVLIIISFFLFFYKLGAPSLFETDEVIYSQVSREIVRTGDWVTPHLYGKEWFIHPPFYMWLTSVTSYIFGDNEFNTRLWNALFAVGLVYLTFLLGKKMFRDGVGLLAGFILATSLQYILQSHIAVFDIPYIFFMLIAVLFFLYWLEDNVAPCYYLAFLAMGFAVLMKGIVGIALPIMIITIYLFAIKGLKKLYNFRIIPGFFLAYLAGGTWFMVEAMIHGKAFTESVFGFYTFGRYIRPIEAHYAPWYFYIFVILFGFIPWISFLPFSLSYQYEKKGDTDNLLTITWLAFIFFFFTLAGTKLPGYIMSFYPFAAISVSKMISDHLSGEDGNLEKKVKNSFKTLLIFSSILIFIGIVSRLFEFPENMDKLLQNINATLLLLGAGGVVSYIVSRKARDTIYPQVILICTMLIFCIYTNNYTMVTVEDFKPMRSISHKLTSVYMNGERILGYNVLNRGSFLHYVDKPIKWINEPYLLDREIKTPGRLYIITNQKDLLSFDQDLTKLMFVVFKSGDMVLLSNQQ